MAKKEIRAWKKVFESDLLYVVSEIKETITRPAMIILTGELGAGKTSLVKAFAHDQNLTSPTYSLIYESSNLVHADFYRIENLEDIIHLELNLYVENKDYFFVEWGGKFLDNILNEVGEHFDVFEIDITMNLKTRDVSRNYVLYEVDKLNPS